MNFKFWKSKAEKSISTIPQGVNINTAYTDEHFRNPITGQNDVRQRGIQVYYLSSLQGMTGRDKEGKAQTVRTERPLFYLTVEQRNEIFRLCSPVFGVVSSRMQRISGMPFKVKPVKDLEDELADQMKSARDIYMEYQNSLDIKHMVIKAYVYGELNKHLVDLRPDLSNFNGSLMRWKKICEQQSRSRCEEIEHWLSEPNTGLTWQEFVKKWVYDYHIHGAATIYKQVNNGKLTNFDLLIGGSTFRIKHPYFSAQEAYVQLVAGFEPQIYFGDEICYSDYVPTSGRSYGMIPLEALINKVSETLLFDEFMAERADGTQQPNKAVIVTDNKNAFGDFDQSGASPIPMNEDEQKRWETKINEPIKGGIVTFTGNTATVVDLSRADTLETQRQRQKDVREEVALVFNMSNMEMNLTGSEQTSGRATSESQAEIEEGKGTIPIIKILELKITRDLLNHRYGYGYVLELEKQKNEREEKELDALALNNGEITVNDVREKYGRSVFNDPKYDLPKNSGGGQAGGDQFNPLFTKPVM